jgi:hypothetical protein
MTASKKIIVMIVCATLSTSVMANGWNKFTKSVKDTPGEIKKETGSWGDDICDLKRDCSKKEIKTCSSLCSSKKRSEIADGRACIREYEIMHDFYCHWKQTICKCADGSSLYFSEPF